MQTIITTSGGPNTIALATDSSVVPIIVDFNDQRGVLRACNSLADDFYAVIGVRPEVCEASPSGSAIVVGTLGSSAMIDELAGQGALDIDFLGSHSEAFTISVVPDPPRLVVCGSDRRGTIYGIYEIARQAGVNPFHFWLNVPPKRSAQLYAKGDVLIKEYPRVRYRGIFLNDEAPALTNWILNTYGTVPVSADPPIPEGTAAYTSAFYTKIFDLLLRLKANYLWPAMWNNAFGEDDGEMAYLADQYGIIMGTSHQEPMTRAQQEWDRRYRATLGHWSYTHHSKELKQFWREGIERNKEYETVVTIGLRGADDTAMGEASVTLLEEIVAAQRAIIAEVHEKPACEVAQLWCLYKEVQGYYEEGLSVPDDVILLWSDDNWGNLRRLPTEEERKRGGGAGIYYHFDYHGDPRNYQWINTTQIAKIWDQMSQALRYEADRLWVVNVGHLKGQEYPISFFLSLAWRGEALTSDMLAAWSTDWSRALFGEDLCGEISSLVESIVELNSRRKPELLYPLPWSLVNYDEADAFVASWLSLRERAEGLAPSVERDLRDAYDHLVLFPARSSHILASLYQAVGRNHLWARQGRFAANEQALLVEQLFDSFTREVERYQSECAGGMWRGFMDQPVLGYIDWNDPPANTLEHLYTSAVPDARYHRLGVAVDGSEEHWPSLGRCCLPPFDNANDQRRRIEIFNRSSKPYRYRIEVADPWIRVEGRVEGEVQDTEKIIVSVDWSLAPEGCSHSSLRILTDERYKEVTVFIEAERVDLSGAHGYIEAGRVLAIDAIASQRRVTDGASHWHDMPLYGPFGAVRSLVSGRATGAHLVYECWFCHSGMARVTVVASPLLNACKEAVTVAVSIDDGPIHTATLVEGEYQVELDDEFWRRGVIDNRRRATIMLKIPTPGAHQLKLWATCDGLMVERIICDLGGVRESLLGPPASRFID